MGSPVREGDQAFRDNGGVDCRGLVEAEGGSQEGCSRCRSVVENAG